MGSPTLEKVPGLRLKVCISGFSSQSFGLRVLVSRFGTQVLCLRVLVSGFWSKDFGLKVCLSGFVSQVRMILSPYTQEIVYCRSGKFRR